MLDSTDTEFSTKRQYVGTGRSLCSLVGSHLVLTVGCEGRGDETDKGPEPVLVADLLLVKGGVRGDRHLPLHPPRHQQLEQTPAHVRVRLQQVFFRNSDC